VAREREREKKAREQLELTILGAREKDVATEREEQERAEIALKMHRLLDSERGATHERERLLTEIEQLTKLVDDERKEKDRFVRGGVGFAKAAQDVPADRAAAAVAKVHKRECARARKRKRERERVKNYILTPRKIPRL